MATYVPQYIRNSRGGAVLRTHVAEIPVDSISPISAALGAGTVAVQQNNQQTVPRRSLCPVMVVFFFLRLVLRFRRSLSRQISTPCCGGSRAQCRWYLFAETSAAITEKSQNKKNTSSAAAVPVPDDVEIVLLLLLLRFWRCLGNKIRKQ